MQLSHFSPKLLAASVALCLGFMATPAMATFSAVSDTNFSYTGTVTAPDGQPYTIVPYTSGGTTYNGRDLSLYAGNEPGIVDDTQITTNWYSSFNGLSDGTANPNNEDSGFVQLVTDGSMSVTSMSGGWTNSSYTTFVMSISGGPTTTAHNRLWAAPSNGAAIETAGQFQNYTFYLTTTFAPGAVTQESPGWFSTTASPLSVAGSFSGDFLNTGSLVAPGSYGFNFTFLDTNWAGANGIAGFSGSYFGASAMAVPEPPTLILFGLFGAAVLGLGSLARRKRLD